MRMPKRIWRPPKPAARNAFPHAAGEKSAIAPASMKPRPMTGTIFTENAPPVTMPVPYSNSHVPGSTLASPRRYRTSVSRAPTSRGGEKLNANFRPGPDRSGIFAARDFRTIAHPAIPKARSASPSHVPIQTSGGPRPPSHQGRAEGRNPHRDPAPAGNRGEGARAFHRFADEAQVI